MQLLGIALGVLSILAGAFWLALSFGHRSRWAQNFVALSDAQAESRRDEGYKVNVLGFYAWFARAPVRAAAFGLALIAFGAWFVSAFRL